MSQVFKLLPRDGGSPAETLAAGTASDQHLFRGSHTGGRALGRMLRTHVVGVDVGGTSTRVVVADLEGVLVGDGHSGGGNPTSYEPRVAAAALSVALDGALATVDPGTVRAGAIGLAGLAKLSSDTNARQAFDLAWAGSGLTCEDALFSDAGLFSVAWVASAAGTRAPDGTILVAGTGAIAARVRDFTLDRVVDGHGWLLGDLGSGFWLGREAVRATLAVCDGRQPDGPLA